MRKNLSNLRQLRANQAGFTLVEIAIVLVIIGLLLGGVLKGQELIENGRIKAAANDMNGILAAHNSYMDRFRRLPGDDGAAPILTARGGQWGVATMTAGDNNGTLVAAAAGALTAPVGEAVSYFQHLRAAGFINGNPADTGVLALPMNPWGGRTTIVNAGVQGRAQPQILVCMGNVPGKSAAALDTQLDDGQIGLGSLRATLGAGQIDPAVAADAVAYTDNGTYTVCRDVT